MKRGDMILSMDEALEAYKDVDRMEEMCLVTSAQARVMQEEIAGRVVPTGQKEKA